MSCPKCNCKVCYQYDDGDDFHPFTENLERCSACGHIFDIDEHAPEDDDEEEFRRAAAQIGEAMP